MTRIQERLLSDGRYRLTKVIGQGGSSVVYLAKDLRVGKTWAVKEITGDPGRVRHEAELLMRLEHPALPGVADLITEGEKSYLVMDYVPGTSLGRLLRRGRKFSVQEIVYIGLSLCDVLEYLHGQSPPVLYRDLKPDNILLTPAGQIRLIDFDIAGTDAGQAQGSGTSFGTRGYAAPEQYRGESSVRSDLYSLGATLGALAKASGHRIDRKFRPLTARCMRKNPRRRFRGTEEVKRRLESMLEEKRQSRRNHLSVLGAVVCLFSVCVLWILIEAEQIRYDNAVHTIRTCMLADAPGDCVSQAQAGYLEAIGLNPYRDEAHLAWLEFMAASGQTREGIRQILQNQEACPGAGEGDFSGSRRRIGELYFCGSIRDGSFPADYRKALAVWEAYGVPEDALLRTEKVLAEELLKGDAADWEKTARYLSDLEELLEDGESAGGSVDLYLAAAALLRTLDGVLQEARQKTGRKEWSGSEDSPLVRAERMLMRAEELAAVDGTYASLCRPEAVMGLADVRLIEGLRETEEKKRSELLQMAADGYREACALPLNREARERASRNLEILRENMTKT